MQELIHNDTLHVLADPVTWLIMGCTAETLRNQGAVRDAEVNTPCP